jgi:hypothetical protein
MYKVAQKQLALIVASELKLLSMLTYIGYFKYS